MRDPASCLIASHSPHLPVPSSGGSGFQQRNWGWIQTFMQHRWLLAPWAVQMCKPGLSPWWAFLWICLRVPCWDWIHLAGIPRTFSFSAAACSYPHPLPLLSCWVLYTGPSSELPRCPSALKDQNTGEKNRM